MPEKHLYAKIYTAGGGIVSGTYLGALIGVFSVCTFAIHNYINLNIGLTWTIYQSIAYFVQWIIVGAVMGLIYKPSWSCRQNRVSRYSLWEDARADRAETTILSWRKSPLHSEPRTAQATERSW